MNATDARALLVQIAHTDLGKTEATRNRAPWIAKLWPATTYPDGMKNREPYCAAGTAWILEEFFVQLVAMGELKKTTGMTAAQAERWRCKSARAFGWQDWATAKALTILPDTASIVPPGCFMVFDMSHIGLTTKNHAATVDTIEYNTGSSGGNDGDGCWTKNRHKKLARCFIDIFDKWPCEA